MLWVLWRLVRLIIENNAIMSSNTRLKSQGLIDLADRMCQDIRLRGLKPGDIYLTADEAASVTSVPLR